MIFIKNNASVEDAKNKIKAFEDEIAQYEAQKAEMLTNLDRLDYLINCAKEFQSEILKSIEKWEEGYDGANNVMEVLHPVESGTVE